MRGGTHSSCTKHTHIHTTNKNDTTPSPPIPHAVLLLILFFLYNYLYFLPLSSGIILSSYSAMTDAKAFNSLQLQCMKMSQVAATANRLHSTKAAGTFDTRHTYTEVDKLMPIENRVQYYTEPGETNELGMR